MTIYKIQRIPDGLFSNGGASPKFTKQGKVWTRLNHLTAHLSLLRDVRNLAKNPHIYDECVVIEYTVIQQKLTKLVDGKLS